MKKALANASAFFWLGWQDTLRRHIFDRPWRYPKIFVVLETSQSDLLRISAASTKDSESCEYLERSQKRFYHELNLHIKNEILAYARMKSADADEIFGFASDEIKSTHPPSRRISSNEVGFHCRRRFHPPERVDLVEKSTDKVDTFFWLGATKKIFLWFVLRIRTQTQNHAKGVYIINSVGIAYHQCGALYIIIAKEDTACG